MLDSTALGAFNSLTEKQVKALDLVAQGYTSKEIGRILDLAPRTVDQRIDTVRAKLDGITRVELMRRYRRWKTMCDPTTYDEFPLTDNDSHTARIEGQRDQDALLFEDSLTYDARAPWQRGRPWLRPGISPSDLGTRGMLLFMLAGAALIMAVAVLSVAFSNGIQTLFEG